MQRSGAPQTRMPFTSKQRYTPPLFMSKPKPLMATEQLMDEIIMQGKTRVLKPLMSTKPLMATEQLMDEIIMHGKTTVLKPLMSTEQKMDEIIHGKTRVPFSNRRYTPPLFMSKPKPLMSTEQLMDEIMHGTRDLPVHKKPLSATIAKLDNDEIRTLSPTQLKSPVNSASTLTMSDHSSESGESAVLDANKMPASPVLLNSTKQSDTISSLSTPFTCPVSSSRNSRSRKNGRHRTSSPEDDQQETRANTARTYSKSPVSRRRALAYARTQSGRKSKRTPSQDDQVTDPSVPPVPPLQTKDAADGQLEIGTTAQTQTRTTVRTHSKSPVSRRRTLANARTQSGRKSKRTPSEDNQDTDPSVPPVPPLQTKDAADGQLETTGTTAQTQTRTTVRTHSKSPVSRRRTLASARTQSGRKSKRTPSEDNQDTDPSVPPVPPLQTKDAADGQLETTGTTAQTQTRTTVPTHSKSPASRRRKLANARTQSGRKSKRTPSEDNQDTDPSVPPVPPLQAEDAADGGDQPAVLVSTRTSERANRRRIQQNSKLLTALLNDNDSSTQSQRPRSSRSTCSRDARSRTKKEVSSSRSVSAPSIERLQSKTAASNTNHHDTPKRRRMTLDERKLRSTSQMMMGSERMDRQSRSRHSFPSAASSSKPNSHTSGFIKSFCGTCSVTDEEYVSTEEDAADDIEESCESSERSEWW